MCKFRLPGRTDYYCMRRYTKLKANLNQPVSKVATTTIQMGAGVLPSKRYQPKNSKQATSVSVQDFDGSVPNLPTASIFQKASGEAGEHQEHFIV